MSSLPDYTSRSESTKRVSLRLQATGMSDMIGEGCKGVPFPKPYCRISGPPRYEHASVNRIGASHDASHEDNLRSCPTDGSNVWHWDAAGVPSGFVVREIWISLSLVFDYTNAAWW